MPSKSWSLAMMLGFWLVAGLTPAALQAQEVFASISGRVLDPSGSVVVGAEVKAVQAQTNLEYRARTNEAGFYVLLTLPTGRYTLTASAQGFKSFRREEIRLAINQRATVDIALELGQTTESVTVRADAPMLQQEEATLSTLFTRERLERIPVTRNSAFALSLLTPGVIGEDKVPIDADRAIVIGLSVAN
ncbi:MAG: carboxypeptidase-like regulatory domain-containing protein, partial [Acidobacteriota bacterium]